MLRTPGLRAPDLPGASRSASAIHALTVRPLVVLLVAALTVLGLVPAVAAAPAAQAAQTLTWTGNTSVTDYASAPATAVAGPATVVFENSVATGNVIAMSHTLTFDTTTPGYNHDVTLDILANPLDANGGRHTREIVLTPGKYRYFCSIPGHLEMWGELVVTAEGGGGEDTTAPSVSAAVTGQQDAAGAYVGSATVALSAADEGSGVASTEYALDGGEFAPYTAPIVVDEPGEHTVAYRATDVAGNVSEAGTATFTVVAAGGEEDTTAPTVSAEVTGEQDEQGAYVDSATVTVTAADEGSGVASVEYDAHGGHWMPYTEPVVVTEPGEHTVKYRATDAAGNVSEEGSVTFTVAAGGGGEEDTTAPTVTAEVTGEQDEQGAYVGTATVALSAADDGSGVASTEYDLDGAGFTAYGEPLVVDEPGEHTVAYRATDVAGNVSETGTVTFTVVEGSGGGEDTTAPAVSAEVTGEQDAQGAYVGTATVAVTATDDGSGVASTEVSVDGGEFAPYTAPVVLDEPGDHTVAYRATDVAGNVSEAGSVTVTVVAAPPGDTTAPQVSARITGARDGAGAYVGRATVSLTASDADSGLAIVEYQVDGGPWRPYTSARIVVTAAGEHTVAYRATDVAGNVSAPASVSFAVASSEPQDTGAPQVTATVSGARDRSGAFMGRATLTLSATDEGSGVALTEYQVDGGAWQRYSAPVVLVGDGVHTVMHRATDVAGNASAVGSVTFTVVATTRDACPGSDVRPTVVIGGHDSTVANVDTGDGCTVNDLVDEHGDHASHRAFLRHVRSTTAGLVEDGVLSGAERRRIIAVATLSDVGR